MSKKWGSKPWRVWASHWKKKDAIGSLRLPLALIVSVIIGCGGGYLIINEFSNWRNWQAFDPQMSIDNLIPVIPWMIIPYATLYFYYPMAALLGMKDEPTQRENIIFHQTFLILTWMIFAIFIIFPVKVDLRSEVFETELGMWQSWYDLLHSVDNPWNAWPSLHIVQSLLAVLVITRWHSYASKIWLVRILWISWFMLMISVMTTKQHFIWDVISGVCIALIAWKYWILPALENSHSKDIVSEFESL